MKRKNLLIYANYYYPDVASTGQILQDLAEGLKNVFNVTVICTVPSYTGIIDDKYKTNKYYVEMIDNVKVIRVKVPEFDKCDKISRIKNILVYFVRTLLATFKIDTQDYIFTISQPPILGGLLGVIGKFVNITQRKECKLIYNIQDFNPEQIIAVNYSKSKLILKMMLYLDKFTCRMSNKVIIVGRDMEETLQCRFKDSPPVYCIINNWVDEKNIYPLAYDNDNVLAFKRKYNIENRFIFMYSGNIGLYYDLENIIKVVEKFKKVKDIAFVFIGEGSVKSKLEMYKEKHNLVNVVFIPYQSKENLIYSLNAGDVHWCVNAKGLKGVSVPSKLYGIMSVGKPVLGVLEDGSEAKIIIEEARCGYVVEPGDYKEIENILQWFIDNKDSIVLKNMGKNGKEYSIINLARDNLINMYIDTIKAC